MNVCDLFLYCVILQRFLTWTDMLPQFERVILRELGYELYVEHPHKFLLHFINCVKPNDFDPKLIEQMRANGEAEEEIAGRQRELEEAWKWNELNQRAWNFLNDS